MVPPFNLSNKELEVLSQKMRKSVFDICLTAKSGHVGGSSGAVELLTTLYFGGILRYNPGDYQDDQRDRVLIRGHLGPIRYSIFAELGFISEPELKTYRTLGSRLQGHEDYFLTPGVDLTPSGSLGMLLSFGVGAAIAAKHKKQESRVFVFIGDGEEQEGNVSEATRHAGRLKLNNLIAVLDANGKQLSDPLSETDSSDIAEIWKGYGWNVLVVENGHDICLLKETYTNAIEKLGEDKPVLIIAHTIKGKGLAGAEEHFSGFHTVSVCPEEIIIDGIRSISHSSDQSLEKLGNSNRKQEYKANTVGFEELSINITPTSNQGSLDFWQEKYLEHIKTLSLDKERYPIFFLTADVTRKDIVDKLELRNFVFYDNVGLREQHLFALAHGLSVTLPSSRIILNTFDAFAYRGMDQLHAMVNGGGNAIILGEYSGLTNSRNGSTHQSSSQPGAIMSMSKMRFLEPWDSTDLFNSLNWALGKSRGVVYIRLHSDPSILIPSGINIDGRQSKNGFYRLFGDIDNPDITLISSGFPVTHCLEVVKELQLEGISARLINIVDHHSLNEEFVKELPQGKPVLTVYNGSPIFLQSNVSSVVMRFPTRIPSRIEGIGFDSGTTGHLNELVKHYGLDSEGILKSIRSLI